VLSVSTALVVGCATGKATFDDEEPTPTGGHTATTTSDQGGGDGGSILTTSSSTSENPCGIDCSTISTPECQVAICDPDSKMCKVVDDTDGAACDDGLFCTINEVCTAGVCGGGGPNDCGQEAPPCSQVACDEVNKNCTSTPLPPGSSCTPTNLCETGGKCTNGLCIGTPKDCFFAPVPNDCHVATCNPQNGMCEPVPGNEGQTCVDVNDLCTDNKTCSNGTCTGGAPKDCSAMTVGCFDGKCDPMSGQCFADPIAPGQPCAAATDDCNAGTCDMMGTCVATPANEGQACNDGLACTQNTVCQSGICGGGMSSIDVYLYEDFSAGIAGWTLGNEWAIGPTAVSSGNSYGNPDPGLDHTVANQDNKVAGVVLGGNAQQTVHGFAYLTSPVVDTSQATTVHLEFWRWLNSDYTPYMQNAVEVFDGNGWVTLWQSGSSPGVQDAAWTKITFDLTAYKSALMQVRWGFKIGSSGVFPVSQWNVDDVLIASGPCI